MKQKNWFSKLTDSCKSYTGIREDVLQADFTLPFLKWAGGKRWLMPMAKILADQKYETYYEPFVGSGAMYFALRPARAVISDTNKDLINTYRAVRTNWQAVYAQLKRHHRNHCSEYYYQVRSSKPRCPHTKAARFIYLNRVCWNGLYRVNRNGVFNTPVGSKKQVILEADDFESVSGVLQSARFMDDDFESVITMAGEGDLIFADPPYTVRHQYNGFVKYNERLFSWSDQERLFEALRLAQSRGALIVCTNADHKSVRDLYKNYFKLMPVNRYSAISGAKNSRGTYAELIITG